MTGKRQDTERRRPNVPEVLTVVLADTQVTQTAIIFENEHRPYQRRTVQIELTPDQRRQLEPRHTGRVNGTDTFEEVHQAWLEPAEEPLSDGGPEA